MEIVIDLIKDFENAVLRDIEEYKNLGFKFEEYDDWKVGKDEQNISEDKYRRDLIHTYANLRQRMIGALPRQILYAENFERLTDYEDGLKSLEDKILVGEELTPHLSRQIFKPGEQDGMLFDFGIYHLHLGVTPDTKHSGLIQGTEKVLYCLFDNEFAYFLIIDNHGRWNDKDMLRIIRDNFPQKLDPWKMNDVVGLCYYPTEDERLKLRKSGVNIPLELDGQFFISPGGGITSAKTSSIATFEMIRVYRKYKKIEEMIRVHFTNNNARIAQKLKEDSLNLSLQSFTPFILIDHDKKFRVELEFSDNDTKIRDVKIISEK